MQSVGCAIVHSLSLSLSASSEESMTLRRKRRLEKGVIVKLQNQSLERILESAVVVSWTDLMRGDKNGLIHIEYDFAPSGTLDCLQVWSSITRGYWLLACSYRMSASQLHDVGIHFENEYKSQGLAHNLAVVMQHQSAFDLPPNLGRRGLLQLTTPTEEESKAAAASLRDALERVDVLAARALAAIGSDQVHVTSLSSPT
jgi:hypothetical protein